jgi:2-dehydro-3-deoxyphosphogluconate aldolase/(4S)-4-hydroxy-2-oxoglutarate aldolase
MDLAAELAQERLLAIVRGTSEAASLAAVRTLAEAGIRLIEVSLTTPGAADVISQARGRARPGTLIGAGTVRTAADVDLVASAGAAFIVTPGMGAAVPAAVRHGLPAVAGALTPGEVMAALAAGAAAVKLFPASLGGPAYLRALRDPFPEVPFVPVGGVDAAAAAQYLAAGAVAVGVGSPLVGNAAREAAAASPGAAAAAVAGLAGRAREFLAVTRPGSAAAGGPARGAAGGPA